MPELLETFLEAKQWMVGPAPRLLGVVSHASAFGPTVDNDDRGVHIEDEGVALMGQGEQIGAQAVVKTHQLSNAFGRKTLQEPAQGALVGKSLQPEHLQESAVVLQNVGLVDTAQAHNDHEEQGHDQLGRVIDRSSLPLVHMLLKKPAQLQPFAKSLDQPHSAEVRKVCFFEGETEFSGPSGHPAQSTLLGAFVPRGFCFPNCRFLHSEN